MFDLMAINNDLNSSELKKINDRISGSLKAINKNMFKVAYLFSDVKENELWLDDFNSMEEYADKCFGLKKSSMYNLIQIGDRFTEKSSDGQTYSCTLGDFSFGQVTQMISLDDITIVELINDGVITPEMSCRKIAEIVKNHKRLTTSGSDETDETETEENEPDETPDTPTQDEIDDVMSEIGEPIVTVYENESGVITVTCENKELAEKIYDLIKSYK